MKIFLEGAIKTGKSTFIAEHLPNDKTVSGFYTKRLFDDTGKVAAYELCRMVTGSKISLEGTYAEQENCFIAFGNCGAVERYELFDTIGISFLEGAEHSDYLLLDEIGGLEILRPVFYERLLDVVGSCKCIGVVKSTANAALLAERTGNSKYLQAYKEFRSRLRLFGVTVISKP